MFASPLPGRRHWQRSRQIARILFQYGFDQLADLIGPSSFVSPLARRLRRQPEDAGTGPQRLRRAIEELGPTFIKLGQVLSTRPDVLPADYVAELTKLQDSAPPFAADIARSLIEAELAQPLDSLFASFEDTPIAAASLGQVHRAVLNSGERVVVKVQRPNLEQVVNTDLDILFDFTRLVQQRSPLEDAVDLVEIVQDFAFTLRNEMDYRREGANADRFRRNFAGDSRIYIPEVYWDYTTHRVLTLEEISGIRILDTQAMDAAGMDHKQVAHNSVQLILKEVFEDGFFHADPHPGNFVVMPNGVIGVMDFGMVGHLDRPMREDLLRLFTVLVRRDSKRMVDQFLRMGVAAGELNRGRLERDIDRIVGQFYGLPLKDMHPGELVSELTALVFHYHLHFPSDLWLLAKTLVMMDGLGRQVDPEFDVFAVSLPYVESMVGELVGPRAWARRLTAEGEAVLGGLLDLPQQWTRIVERIERGEFTVRITQDKDQAQLASWDAMATRLGLSLLIAALIVGVALLAPQAAVGRWQWLVPALVVLGLVSVIVLTVAWFWTVRPRRWK